MAGRVGEPDDRHRRLARRHQIRTFGDDRPRVEDPVRLGLGKDRSSHCEYRDREDQRPTNHDSPIAPFPEKSS